MIIYSSSITPRLRYITAFAGKALTGKAFLLTDSKDEFSRYAGGRINYSLEQITADEFWLQPYALLFEKEIKPHSIECFEMDEQKIFFKTGGDIPFDIFAASFYLLSRYEEYLPHQKDIYGRYAYTNSLAFKEGFLDKPLINIWLKNFKSLLLQKFPDLELATPNFECLFTYDIDEAYSYKYKDWWRNAGGGIKELLKGKFNAFSLRRKVVNNNAADPFDSYAWMDQLHEQYGLQPRYFFLVSEKNGKYDRNILPKKEALQQLIKKYAAKYKLGVHPSWQSGDDLQLIKKEKESIEYIIGKKIISSRQHFIRFHMPETFRYLIDAGITEDFSMGYGSINGFRASVASPFYWYDLEKEEGTALLLYPFCYMEANSFYEQKFTAQQALSEMKYYYGEVKKVNGIFISIWHNTFLGTDKKFEGWREIYKQFLEEISS